MNWFIHICYILKQAHWKYYLHIVYWLELIGILRKNFVISLIITIVYCDYFWAACVTCSYIRHMNVYACSVNARYFVFCFIHFTRFQMTHAKRLVAWHKTCCLNIDLQILDTTHECIDCAWFPLCVHVHALLDNIVLWQFILRYRCFWCILCVQ